MTDLGCRTKNGTTCKAHTRAYKDGVLVKEGFDVALVSDYLDDGHVVWLDLEMPSVQDLDVVTEELGPSATWLACSHGDVIKAIVADALGLHLDQFQRILVDPCSVTVIRYTETRPFVVRVNDTGGGVADLLPAPKKGRKKASSDAPVGGGAGA